jgi:hypothetical protein
MKKKQPGTGVDEQGSTEDTHDWGDDPNIDYDEAGHPEAESTSQWEGYEGFSRNPVFVRGLASSQLYMSDPL